MIHEDHKCLDSPTQFGIISIYNLNLKLLKRNTGVACDPPCIQSRYRVLKFEDWIGIKAENCKKVTRMVTPVGHLFQVWVAKCGIATQFSDPVEMLLGGFQALASFGAQGQLRIGVSACCGGAKKEWGHQEVEAGFGAVGPEAEVAVGYLFDWRLEKNISWQIEVTSGVRESESKGQCGKFGMEWARQLEEEELGGE
ncbi:uncharacterized protein PGTG_12834 [Puccinia graminis f. sp. tritici CRL 75-36-700-3]|uniref:Uncharacterized protein n=1 Tax=Puccinia graminis f. sp. tritici (strain CRL 75-36-700-3 / race SCCL) TaxID=418459 RepID=E3KSG4_PUCGT|nr:uncharacterized protein PGTG_12834 [Puccinia graminis f. sp. tritici CRL 75-36-700-3]EFP87250.1 hypothetical protein PGTG_12834 [Puccinia graminis f. sp. tritici CRL 75-36-700-3]